MCGRYASAEDPASLRMFFETVEEDVEVLAPNYNVAPTQPVYVVDEMSGQRRLRVVQWGLVPSWVKAPSTSAPLINARAETVAEKPSFRAAFAKTRCIVPATGWYEWRTIDVPDKVKRPYYLSRSDAQPLAFGGLLEAWLDPTSGQWLRTCAIITTTPCAELLPIHDRMPVVLERENWARWLNPATPTDDLFALLGPTPAGRVQVHEVAQRVNSIRNNGAELLLPLETI